MGRAGESGAAALESVPAVPIGAAVNRQQAADPAGADAERSDERD